jgi:hypothetical protein
MAINLYSQYEQQDREVAAAAYLAAPEFPAIEAEAAQRGYRKATIGEINASANSAPWAVTLFCWRGGLWVAA